VQHGERGFDAIGPAGALTTTEAHTAHSEVSTSGQQTAEKSDQHGTSSRDSGMAPQILAALTTVHPSEQRIGGPDGGHGYLASPVGGHVLLALFYRLAAVQRSQNSFGWLGTANDWVIGQFLVLIPVAMGLRGRLPLSRLVRVSTAIAIAAMVAVAALQLLLVAGVLDFDVEVLLVVAAFLLVYAWVLVVSLVGHRHGTLPRSVTRFGLLLGASFPVALLITAAGYLVGWGFGHPLAFAIPGIMLGAMSWLAFPAWPLVLARMVFGIKPSTVDSDREMEGMS
jgi:hypothetical protein